MLTDLLGLALRIPAVGWYVNDLAQGAVNQLPNPMRVRQRQNPDPHLKSASMPSVFRPMSPWRSGAYTYDENGNQVYDEDVERERKRKRGEPVDDPNAPKPFFSEVTWNG